MSLPIYPLYRKLGGPHCPSGRVRKIPSPPAFDTRTVQAIASRCINYSIPAHKNNPYTVLDRTWGFQEVDFPKFQDMCMPYWTFRPLKIKLTFFSETSRVDYPLTRRQTPAAMKLRSHSREKPKIRKSWRSRATYLYTDARLTKWKVPTFSHKASRLAVAL